MRFGKNVDGKGRTKIARGGWPLAFAALSIAVGGAMLSRGEGVPGNPTAASSNAPAIGEPVTIARAPGRPSTETRALPSGRSRGEAFESALAVPGSHRDPEAIRATLAAWPVALRARYEKLRDDFRHSIPTVRAASRLSAEAIHHGDRAGALGSARATVAFSEFVSNHPESAALALAEFTRCARSEGTTAVGRALCASRAGELPGAAGEAGRALVRSLDRRVRALAERISARAGEPERTSY